MNTKRKPTIFDGKRYFKGSGADHGMKIDVIQTNIHKYSVSGMCDVLDIPKRLPVLSKKAVYTNQLAAP